MDSGYYLIDVSVAYAAGELSAQVAGIRYVKDGTTVSLTADAQLPFTKVTTLTILGNLEYLVGE